MLFSVIIPFLCSFVKRIFIFCMIFLFPKSKGPAKCFAGPLKFIVQAGWVPPAVQVYPHRCPARSFDLRRPAQSFDLRLPAQSFDLRLPARSSGHRRPARSSGLRLPARSSGLRLPARSSGLRRPARSFGLRLPDQSLKKESRLLSRQKQYCWLSQPRSYSLKTALLTCSVLACLESRPWDHPVSCCWTIRHRRCHRPAPRFDLYFPMDWCH